MITPAVSHKPNLKISTTMVCSLCGRPGHYKTTCTYADSTNSRARSSSPKKNKKRKRTTKGRKCDPAGRLRDGVNPSGLREQWRDEHEAHAPGCVARRATRGRLC